MKEILGTLVEYPTVTADREANNEALDYVGDFLAQRGMYVAPYEFGGFRSFVATTYPGVMTPKVMLANHIDVVPTSAGAYFTPTQMGDRLYGRGMLDMKFSIAADLSIIDDLYREGKLSEYDLGVMITTDEELGGYEGTARLVEMGYRPNVCILPDGGDNWQLQTSSKGFLHYRVSTTGRSVHSREPWNGENAILNITSIMGKIQKLFPNMGEETNTSSPNIITGGRAVNQVPDYAAVEFDARFVNTEEMNRLCTRIGRICMAHSAEMDVLAEGAPANFDLKGPYLAPFARLVTEVTGIDIKGARTLGSSDARFFAKYGIPVISLYPTGGGHHSNDEWISETAIYQFKDVLRKYLDETAHIPDSTSTQAA